MQIDTKVKPITEEDVDKKFEQFLKECYRCQKKEKQDILRKAYNFARLAHKNQTRYNGDAFINHPLEVAKIVTLDIGLGTTSAVAAFLHDTVTDTDTEIDDIRVIFGNEIARLVESLAKIKGTSIFFNINKSEVYKRLLVGISEDIRIIYIKIADRLHNMRTLYSLEPEKKFKVASETMYVYAPLAVRLGLYNIKSELEDLAFKYLDPHNYNQIASQIKDSEYSNIMYLNKVALPVIYHLRKEGFDFEITSRQKSIYSIWQKIKRKGVSFKEVYDLFAMRIIFKPRDGKDEKDEIFFIKKIVESLYVVKPDRIRDWVTKPKENGYEALHLTVLGPRQRWVEIQIRSERMHYIAQHGFASHWIYKGMEYKKVNFDEKIRDLRKRMEKVDEEDFDFLSNFKLLFSTEIVAYTPKGKEIILPVGATALDFAFAVHTKIGLRALAVKVNNTIKPLDYQVQNGDYVYVLTSENMKPKPEWLKIVRTDKAKQALKEFFGLQNLNERDLGMRKVQKALRMSHISPTPEVFKFLIKNLNVNNKNELYIKIGSGDISAQELRNVIKKYVRKRFLNFVRNTKFAKDVSQNFEVAKCCRPLPGDEVVVQKEGDRNVLHRANCKNVKNQSLKSEIFKWKLYADRSFYVKLAIEAENIKGLLTQISKALSEELEVNIKSLFLDTDENGSIIEGWIEISVFNLEHLNIIVKKLRAITGIRKIERLFT